MAATTPNLGLTLPVGNEKVSRQIINGNNSIIDTAFGSAGAKLIDIELDEVTNVSGSYTGTTYDDRVTASMKALEIELGNPGAFRDNIVIDCGAGYITLSCNNVVGTSTVKVSVLKLVEDPTQVTSTEFDILNNRIGTLSNLTTTDKTSTVAAVNEVNQSVSNLKSDLGIVEDGDAATHAISAGQYVIWKGELYTADAAISVGETLASSGGSKNLTACTNGGLNALNNKITDLIISKNFWQSSQSGSGNKTITITIPAGYTLLSRYPTEIFCSGADQLKVNDTYLSQNGTTVTLTAYVYNPQGASNYNIGGAILLIKSGINTI